MDCPYIRHPVAYSIEDGMVTWTYSDGHCECATIRTFRIMEMRAHKLLADYDAKLAEIIPLKKRRGHAAASP